MTQFRKYIFLTLLMLLFISLKAENSDYIWWEAEACHSNTFPKTSDFLPHTAQEKEKLSGGTWLQTNKGANAEASWEVTTPTAGTYTLWVRKFWLHGPFQWQFNNQAPRECTRKCELADSIYLRKFVCANWVKLGTVTLPAGKNTLKIKLNTAATVAAFDCWLLTKKDFTPNGAKKPGEKYNRTEDGWFAFEPDQDKFTGKELLNLRNLNQEYAGIDGHIKTQGPDFIFEKTGKKVKFWAINTLVFADKERVKLFAKKLAKRGVNMIRIHSPIYDKDGPDPSKVNMRYLDSIHFFIHAMAQEGIYTKMSFYFPLWVQLTQKFGLPGYNNEKEVPEKDTFFVRPFGMIYFHPHMQNIYKSWLKIMLKTQNPYSGKTLAEDPALAIIELVNEDGLFFWSFAPYKNPTPECMTVLEKLLGSWLSKKYGSIENAIKHWGTEKMPKHKDYPDQGRVAFYENTGFMGSFDWAKKARNPKRIQDQVQFLVETQRNFYKTMSTHIKHDLAYKGLTSASNWHTVDNNILGALEKYTYTVCDVIDRHGYFNCPHKGDAASWSVRKGHTYSDKSGLTVPDSLTKEIQYGNHPHMISEYNYPMPNRYRGEGPFMIATYGSLAGTDAFFYFRNHSIDWQKSNPKFPVHTPSVLGQFPAFAYIYRQGLISEGPKVADITLSLKNLYELKGTPVAQPQHLDDLRKKDIPEGGTLASNKAEAIDPLAYYVGQVQINFSPTSNASKITDLSPFIDRNNKTITSATKQLFWNWKTGISTFNTYQAQGVCGFLKKAGKIQLQDLTIESNNDYCTIAAVALDGKPIKNSSKILLQVMTEDRNYGWKTTGSKTKTITDLGAPPIIVKNISGTVTINHTSPANSAIYALDVNGYKTTKLQQNNNQLRISLLKNVFYYIIMPNN